MSLQPVDIPLGAMRCNSDSQKLEYFNGDAWFQIQTFSPDLNGGARGFTAGGSSGPYSNVIEYYTIPTLGNAQDFGDLTQARGAMSAQASRTRGVFVSGYTPTKVNTCDYVQIASKGNAVDFGDAAKLVTYTTGCSSSVRGVFVGADLSRYNSVLAPIPVPTLILRGSGQTLSRTKHPPQ